MYESFDEAVRTRLKAVTMWGGAANTSAVASPDVIELVTFSKLLPPKIPFAVYTCETRVP